MKISSSQKIMINALTASRIVTAVWIFFSTDEFLLFIAVYGGVSDFLDGFLARRYSLQSKTGERLDQISDKVFHLAFFYYLVVAGEMSFAFAFLFWLREILVVLLRWMNKASKQSNFLGRLKTFLAYFLIILIIAKRIFFSSALDSIPLIATFEIIIVTVSYLSLILSFKKN